MPKLYTYKRKLWEPKPVDTNKPGQGRKYGGNQAFYKSKAWRDVRKAGLIREPFCKSCAERGITTEGKVRDHIKPINPENAYDIQNGKYPNPLDMSNHQTLCIRCHNRKSGKEAHK